MNANKTLAHMQGIVESPPIGFRKAIGAPIKLIVMVRQGCVCTTCGKRIERLDDVQFDHVPALQLRQWDPLAKDTRPGSNDPSCIFAKHIDCHAEKTTGRKGESKLSRVGGDISEVAKIKRITKQQDDFRKAIFAKDDVADRSSEPIRPKTQWPKRKFPERRNADGSRSKRNKTAG